MKREGREDFSLPLIFCCSIPTIPRIGYLVAKVLRHQATLNIVHFKKISQENRVTKLEFLAAFRLACDTLPGELVEAAVADYERQFTDALLAGELESAIVQRWGAPQHAALKLKLGTFNGNLKQVVTAEKVARVGFSGAHLQGQPPALTPRCPRPLVVLLLGVD